MKSVAGAMAFVFLGALVWSGTALADPPGDPAAVKNEDGKYYDAQGNPTYSIQPDGSGIARVQSPPAGAILHEGERIRVRFAR